MASSEAFDLEAFYHKAYAKERSSAVATLKTLIQFLHDDSFSSLYSFSENFRAAIERLKEIDCRSEVQSVAEIFFHFLTLKSEYFYQVSGNRETRVIILAFFIESYLALHQDLNLLRQELFCRSELYLTKVLNSRCTLARNGQRFIIEGCKILVHSMSRAVLETLIEARQRHNKRFIVYVTESAPDYNGKLMHERLLAEDIDSTLILDSAVGYICERVDLVLVGAEGVLISGGIINKVM